MYNKTNPFTDGNTDHHFLSHSYVQSANTLGLSQFTLLVNLSYVSKLVIICFS